MATITPEAPGKYHFSRRIVQVISLLVLNPVFFQFKEICIPVMNCWSCPAAAFACPIGAMGYHLAAGFVPWLVIGIILAAAILVGRMLCGWICPFGFIQELINKIPGPKLEPPRILLLTKYAILVLTVFLAAAFLRNTQEHVYFCSWCPAGSLEAALPVKGYEAAGGNISEDPKAAAKAKTEGSSAAQKKPPIGVGVFAASLLGYKKVLILLGTLLGMVFINRFFCKLICPIGAMFAVFNKISFYSMNYGRGNCEGCKTCYGSCTQDKNLKPADNSPECVRCLDCLPTVCETKYEITLKENWCKNCTFCASFCPQNVFEADPIKGIKIAHPEQCIGCGWCTKLCPDFGITVTPKGMKTPEEREQLSEGIGNK
jgi:Pyruvate/2-oxoacid:ferredoxin oxidoreductase delta subunit